MQEVGGSIPPGSTNLRRFAASVGKLQTESRLRAAFGFWGDPNRINLTKREEFHEGQDRA